MSDTYFDLPSRLEDSFPEIDSDIVTDLRKTSEEYVDIQQQISDLKKQFPCIMKVMEDKGEIHLTAEEHAAFVQCLRLSRDRKSTRLNSSHSGESRMPSSA